MPIRPGDAWYGTVPAFRRSRVVTRIENSTFASHVPDTLLMMGGTQRVDYPNENLGVPGEREEMVMDGGNFARLNAVA